MDNSNKTQFILLILEVLKRYSDEKHKLTMQEIIRHLKAEYGVTCDWRTVKSNLLTLMECNYDKYDDISRYRLDLISGVKVLEEKRKPKSKVKKGIMTELIDWLGKDFRIINEDEDSIQNIFEILW